MTLEREGANGGRLSWMLLLLLLSFPPSIMLMLLLLLLLLLLLMLAQRCAPIICSNVKFASDIISLLRPRTTGALATSASKYTQGWELTAGACVAQGMKWTEMAMG